MESTSNCIGPSLEAARHGDREAFVSLVSAHTLRIQRLALRFTRSPEDAEDVCQESLLKAFTKLEQFSEAKVEQREFCAWLMKITANCAIDFLRRKKAGRHVPLEECTTIHGDSVQGARLNSWGETPEMCCRRTEQLRMVAEAISQLPPQLRTVCLLRNIMELSGKEVAARLGISPIAVRLRLFRAHDQLREILTRHARRRCGRNRFGREDGPQMMPLGIREQAFPRQPAFGTGLVS